MTNRIAVVKVQLGTHQVQSATFSKTSLKFKCQRCAVFCCRCGGPRLLPKDVMNLKQSGKISTLSTNARRPAMLNKEDGSCVFLTENSRKIFACEIYNFRPTSCRIYPFYFERTEDNVFSLNLIPCCNGLNAIDGELVDIRFFIKHLKKPFLALLEQDEL